MRQGELELKTWGGRREGAGRRPAAGSTGRAHAGRGPVRAYQPVHVTLRFADFVWNLRSQRSFRIIDGALRGIRWRPDFRVVHFSIQGNHVHLIVEASGSGVVPPHALDVSPIAQRLGAACLPLLSWIHYSYGAY